MSLPRKERSTEKEFQFDYQELQNRVDIHRTGTLSQRQEQEMYFISIMEKYIQSQLNHFRNKNMDTEDVKHDIYIEIITNLDKYEPISSNGYQQSPLSFFGNRIKGVANKGCLAEHITPHFNKIIQDVKKMCNAEKIPFTSDEIWIDKYSKILDIPTESIRSAFELYNLNICSEEAGYNKVSDDWSPEKRFEKTDLQESVARALDKLTPLEKKISQKFSDEIKDVDLKTAINNHYEYYGLDQPLSTQAYNKLVATTKTKLANLLEVDKATSGYITKKSARLQRVVPITIYSKEKLAQTKEEIMGLFDDEE